MQRGDGHQPDEAGAGLEAVADVRECGVEAAPDRRGAGDYRYGDERSNQSVFDGRRTRLVARQELKKPHRGLPPSEEQPQFRRENLASRFTIPKTLSKNASSFVRVGAFDIGSTLSLPPKAGEARPRSPINTANAGNRRRSAPFYSRKSAHSLSLGSR